MNRRIRLSLLAPLAAAALLTAPAAFAWAPSAAAAPTATCSISGVMPDGTVRLSGGGFAPGTAFLSSPTAAGGSFTIGSDGGFQMASVENARYTVSQGNDRTECSGFSGTDQNTTDQNTQNQNSQHQNNNQNHHNNRNNRNN
ncbi:hypothetical protein AMK16_02100 [Streptomyces sp. CB00455]|uniref:hypothetical protein n=1 Tax=Streptomyces sp. CB00455 TaxID=1703927 RepID=UPI00093B35BD|nr:hypothetical protein [Streptomyces sp. CB00455]OKK22044.1 hypothetical protein AMK16_02100 [Streptomyces sp. CB00455]